MLNLSLSQTLARSILPTSPEPLSLSGDDNNTAFGVFAPELLDQIIDHLHNDRRTLLRLGLTSRKTLTRSRFHLFSELEFNPYNGGERKFKMFLTLLQARWTSFTNAVESLHVERLFSPGRDYTNFPNMNFPRILANLPNLMTLRLTSISWLFIPRYIREFFLQINIVNLQLDSVEFTTCAPIVEIFVRLQPSIKSITLHCG
jgi:hypothetical protein